jgi:hypothetical protein
MEAVDRVGNKRSRAASGTAPVSNAGSTTPWMEEVGKIVSDTTKERGFLLSVLMA